MRFSRTTLVSLVALIMLVGGLATLGVLRDPNAPVGPSTYSRSAIGHAGLLKLLQMRGIRAEASQGASRDKVRRGGLLVLAEPDRLPDPAELRLLLSAPRVLLVLPKWAGFADSAIPGWIRAAARLPMIVPIGVLQDSFFQNGNASTLTMFDLQRPLVLAHNALGVAPVLKPGVQLYRGTLLDSVVDSPSGILVGQRLHSGTTLYVLTDPDVISNHGLAAGNAPFALALIDRARAGGPVVFDETIHGFRTVPRNKLLSIFSRPFAAVTFSALMAAGLLAWADGRRFGAPWPGPGGVPAGQLMLIGTIAGLLDRGGHQASVLARYVRGTVTDVGASLQRSRAESAARIAEAESRRGTSIRSADLLQQAAAMETARRVTPENLSALALRAYAWKQEMMHGFAGHPRDL
jgi:hypothetical protein